MCQTKLSLWKRHDWHLECLAFGASDAGFTCLLTLSISGRYPVNHGNTLDLQAEQSNETDLAELSVRKPQGIIAEDAQQVCLVCLHSAPDN